MQEKIELFDTLFELLINPEDGIPLSDRTEKIQKMIQSKRQTLEELRGSHETKKSQYSLILFRANLVNDFADLGIYLLDEKFDSPQYYLAKYIYSMYNPYMNIGIPLNYIYDENDFKDIPNSDLETLKEIAFNRIKLSAPERYKNLMEHHKGKLTFGVGYTFYVPDTFNSNSPAIVTYVYGGGSPYPPKDHNKLGCFDKEFLKAGIIIAQLNGEDVRQKLASNREVSAREVNTVHLGINAFLDQYRAGNLLPETIHGISLGSNFYNNTTMTLYGASYGGGVIMKHAERFPGKFNGYMSHAGFLNPDKMPDLSIKHHLSSVIATKLLSPNCSSIEQDLLLLHNVCDLRVPLYTSENFYKECRTNGKGNVNFIVNEDLTVPKFDHKGKPFYDADEDYCHYSKHWCERPDDMAHIINFIKNGY